MERGDLEAIREHARDRLSPRPGRDLACHGPSIVDMDELRDAASIQPYEASAYLKLLKQAGAVGGLITFEEEYRPRPR